MVAKKAAADEVVTKDAQQITEEKTTENPARKAQSDQGAEYTAAEIAAAVSSVFKKDMLPDCVIAAFRVAGLTKATKDNAKEIVEKFMKREVK